MMNLVKRIIPPLSNSFHKGQSGKIAIIGGCLEYTGAPYFAGSAVLKLGGDLSHIFCSESATIPIKSYSPDQIVHPYLPPSLSYSIIESVSKVMKWSESIDSFVIGPGLGRDDSTFEFFKEILPLLRKTQKPVIIDGDGLFFLSQSLNLIEGYQNSNIILTPNCVEFDRFTEPNLKEFSSKYGNLTIVRKGLIDLIANSLREIEVTFEEPNPRRVGGQGDILAGAIGLFSSYSYKKNKTYDFLEACEAACFMVKHAAKQTFLQKGRSMLTSDILENLKIDF
jgi:ATP-dependent NAD(P)H-hydrate dehydratase